MRWLGFAAAVIAAGLLLASCRFIPTADVAALANAGAPNGAGVFDPGQDGGLDLVDEGCSVRREKGGSVWRGARPRRQIARRGGRQIRLSREVRGHAVDAHGQARRRHHGGRHANRALRPSASTRQDRARRTRSCRSAPPCAAPRFGTRSTSSRSTISPTRSTSPATARRSTLRQSRGPRESCRETPWLGGR